MFHRIALAAVILATVSFLARPCRAQVEPEKEELREIIRALEKSLQAIAEQKAGNARVTQIGGAGGRMRETQMVVRIYDLSDLFAMAPPYPALHSSDLTPQARPMFQMLLGSGPAVMGGGMGGGGFFSVKDATGKMKLPAAEDRVLYQQTGPMVSDARASMDDLIDAITSTISPDRWDDVGGEASIAQLGTSLLISADAQMHEQIDALFSLFRQRWGTLRTVSIRAHWLWLTDAELTSLLSRGQGNEKGKEKEKADAVRGFGLVDDDAFKDVLAKHQDEVTDQGAGYQAVVTCYNGQTVHTVSGGQSVIIAGMTPVVGGDIAEGAAAPYQPTVAIIQEGAALQVTPIVNTSGKVVVLDVHSRVNQIREPAAGAEAPKPNVFDAVGSPRSIVGAIDRPLVMTHRLSTTLRIPVDRVMLVGGMTFESVPRAGQRNLYLFVEVSVQELRDDLTSEPSKPSPTLEKAPATDAGKPAPKKKPPRSK